MSLNDPHLEAQMELENRHRNSVAPAPESFANRLALVVGVLVGLAGLAWLVAVLLH
jgi:hypothetical protein